MFSIRQTATGWELLDAAGVVLASFGSYDLAVADITDRLAGLAALAVPVDGDGDGVPDGALPERWESGEFGEALRTSTGPGRDFSECVYSYRPGPLPLMLQTSTEMGHAGATLAGWSDVNVVDEAGIPRSAGWLHDNEAGREARRILAAQGRFGVSVDPSENVDVEYECVEEDDDGWCVAEVARFLSYEIAGRTLTPFPGFQDAYLTLSASSAAPDEEEAEDEDDDAAEEGADGEEAVAASAGAADLLGGRPAPPRAYLTMPEPEDDDPRYVEQRARSNGAGTGRAIPLTIEPPDADGWRHFYGHFAAAGTCHIGYPDQCLTYPPSPTGYANFHLGVLPVADGDPVPVGSLVYGLDHARLSGLSLAQARDYYAHTGLRWGYGVAVDGRHGGWITGVMAPDVPDEVVRVLSASGLSGDWRDTGGDLDLVAIQSVNLPGFPITRQALAAAGVSELPEPRLRVRSTGGRTVSATGLGVVRRDEAAAAALAASGLVACGSCADRAAARRRPALSADTGDLSRRLDGVEALLRTLEARTRHLVVAERDALAARLRG